MHRDDRDARAQIASYVGPHALSPETSAALDALGYDVVPGCTPVAAHLASPRPRLRLVDERQLEEIPDANDDPNTPVILVTGSRPRIVRDPRIIGRAERPAQLSALYPIIQRSMEQTPRSTPRVVTHLPARCTRADHRWIGNVVSLSQGGCRLESDADLALGQQMNLEFALPGGDPVCTRALVVHRSQGCFGVVFVDPGDDVLDRIGEFVAHHLATH